MKTILGNKTWNGFGRAGARTRYTYAAGNTFCVYVFPARKGEVQYGSCHHVSIARDRLPKPEDKRAVVRIRVIPKRGRPTIYSMNKKIAQEYHNAVQR